MASHPLKYPTENLHTPLQHSRIGRSVYMLEPCAGGKREKKKKRGVMQVSVC